MHQYEQCEWNANEIKTIYINGHYKFYINVDKWRSY